MMKTMKVLAMFTTYFSYFPANKNIDSMPDVNEGAEFENCILAFIHVEADDEHYDIGSREKKLVNHLKWILRKNNCKTLVLHSFAHLSASKASPEYTLQLLDAAQKRLENGGIKTAQTPFAYFLDLDIKAPGFSLARIWADL